uniref:Uncharacterized protein n=1 Tax=Plectus sambesii TaxID=2011161 RepID=A0A914W297_9BILA
MSPGASPVTRNPAWRPALPRSETNDRFRMAAFVFSAPLVRGESAAVIAVCSAKVPTAANITCPLPPPSLLKQLTTRRQFFGAQPDTTLSHFLHHFSSYARLLIINSCNNKTSLDCSAYKYRHCIS